MVRVELDGTTTGEAYSDAGDALVQPRGEGEWWWMQILAEAGGMAPAMGVVGGRKEGSGLVQGMHARERKPKE